MQMVKFLLATINGKTVRIANSFQLTKESADAITAAGIPCRLSAQNAAKFNARQFAATPEQIAVVREALDAATRAARLDDEAAEYAAVQHDEWLDSLPAEQRDRYLAQTQDEDDHLGYDEATSPAGWRAPKETAVPTTAIADADRAALGTATCNACDAIVRAGETLDAAGNCSACSSACRNCGHASHFVGECEGGAACLCVGDYPPVLDEIAEAQQAAEDRFAAETKSVDGRRLELVAFWTDLGEPIPFEIEREIETLRRLAISYGAGTLAIAEVLRDGYIPAETREAAFADILAGERVHEARLAAERPVPPCEYCAHEQHPGGPCESGHAILGVRDESGVECRCRPGAPVCPACHATIGEDEICPSCRVSFSDPCDVCGLAGYHAADCSTRVDDYHDAVDALAEQITEATIEATIAEAFADDEIRTELLARVLNADPETDAVGALVDDLTVGVETFERAGLLTRERGVVLRVGAFEFQVTIKRSR